VVTSPESWVMRVESGVADMFISYGFSSENGSCVLLLDVLSLNSRYFLGLMIDRDSWMKQLALA
jgi:hypothetical protein